MRLFRRSERSRSASQPPSPDAAPLSPAASAEAHGDTGAPAAEASAPPSPEVAPPSSAASAEAREDTGAPATEDLRAAIVEALRTIFDPEIPVNIYDLGLIYDIDIRPQGEVFIRMTLTSPNCPEAATLPRDVQRKVKSVPGVRDANVELVWDPPFSLDMMSEAAKLQLNLL